MSLFKKICKAIKQKTLFGCRFRFCSKLLPYGWRMYYYETIKPIFKPQHTRIRKAVPRQWCDIVTLVVDVNFEMIKSFYEDEFLNGHVEWDADNLHKEFAIWLRQAYNYITVERPKLEAEMYNSYPKESVESWRELFVPVTIDGKKMYEFKPKDDRPYEVKYADVIRIEKIIKDTDTKILSQFIEKRDFFWT